jgi:hypothetical protein
MHKTICRDSYGNLVPCAFETRELWNPSPSEPSPEDGEDGGSGLLVPTLRAWVGWVNLITALGRNQVYRILKGMIMAGSDFAYIIMRQLIEWEFIVRTDEISDVERVLPGVDLIEGTVDLNIYLRNFISEIVPQLEAAGIDIPTTEELIVRVPELNSLYKFVEAVISPDLGNYFWAALGFAPHFTIAPENWLNDACGYIMEPGIFGSEFIDDVLGIIFPTSVGIIDAVWDIASGLYKGIAFINEFFHGYNLLRSFLMSTFTTIRDEGLSSLLGMIDQDLLAQTGLTIEDISNLLFDESEYVLDWLNERMPELPEFSEELMRKLANVIDRQEFSITDPNSFINAILLHFGMVGDAIALGDVLRLLFEEWDEFSAWFIASVEQATSPVGDTSGDEIYGPEPQADGRVIPPKLGEF